VNVYVVTLCWLRQGATAIGASWDLEGAREIADRRGADGPNEPRWGPWYDDMVPTGQPAKQIRHRIRPDGAVDVHEWQEIVALPLADPGPRAQRTIRGPGWSYVSDAAVPAQKWSEQIAEIGRAFGAP
jgi:hypothetical protein